MTKGVRREVKQLHGFYILRNQNCFRSVIKHYPLMDSLKSFQYAVHGGHTSYPTKYPCVITVATGFFGYHYPEVTTYTVDDFKNLIKQYEEIMGVL